MANLSREISKVGGVLKGPPIVDGEFHRLPELGKNRSDDAVWYIVREMGNGLIYASFGNWRSGEQCDWNSRGSFRQLSSSDRAAVGQARQGIEIKRKSEKEKAALEAEHQWNLAKPAGQDHPYLARIIHGGRWV
jgi:phage/plasmid primase-like uncharacterized protein